MCTGCDFSLASGAGADEAVCRLGDCTSTALAAGADWLSAARAAVLVAVEELPLMGLLSVGDLTAPAVMTDVGSKGAGTGGVGDAPAPVTMPDVVEGAGVGGVAVGAASGCCSTGPGASGALAAACSRVLGAACAGGMMPEAATLSAAFAFGTASFELPAVHCQIGHPCHHLALPGRILEHLESHGHLWGLAQRAWTCTA